MSNNENDQELLDPAEIGSIKKPYIRKQKKEEKPSMKKPIIATVIITLAVVAAFAATYQLGVNNANQAHADRAALIESVTNDLKAKTPQQ